MHRHRLAGALAAGTLHPPSLEAVGFVHLSSLEHLHRPANRLFRGRHDLVLLCVDPELAGVDVYWEPGDPPDPDVAVFPHAYGPIPTRAVTAVLPYRPAADGSFGTPRDVPDRGDLAGRCRPLPHALPWRQATESCAVTRRPNGYGPGGPYRPTAACRAPPPTTSSRS